MATIKDVAKLAGVSSAMVSRYLNDGYVAADKRPLIAAAIDQIGYRPSQQARNLRSGKANLVGVVVPKIVSETVGNVTSGIEGVLRGRGYQMLLADSTNDPASELEFLRLFESYPVDGIVLVATEVTDGHREFFSRTRVPCVVVGQHVDGVSSVYHDDRGGAAELGRRIAAAHPGARAAYIGVTEGDRAVGVERRDGFLAGLGEGGIEVPEERRRTSSFTAEGGHEAALSLIDAAADAGEPLDLIGCATDIIAAGALQAVGERFGSAPGTDGAPVVTGFGHNELVEAMSGGIPTVRLDHLSAGTKAAELLLDAIDNDDVPPASVRLGYSVANI